MIKRIDVPHLTFSSASLVPSLLCGKVEMLAVILLQRCSLEEGEIMKQKGASFVRSIEKEIYGHVSLLVAQWTAVMEVFGHYIVSYCW